MASELMSTSSVLLLLFSLSLLSFTWQSTSTPNYLAKSCTNDTVWDQNSNYQNNLNSLLRSLSSNATSNPKGFFISSAGTSAANEAVYGLFLCRGDQNATSCATCVTFATATDLPKKCSNSKSAIIWYDECMVRYSNKPLWHIMSNFPIEAVWSPIPINGETLPFVKSSADLFDKAKAKAAEDESGRKFATGIETWEGVGKLYGLVQCTPDLTPSDCSTCLTAAIGSIPFVMAGSALRPSCFMQFANYSFFHATANVFPSPIASSGSGKKGGSNRVVFAIVVPIVAVFVGLLAICMCLLKKKRANDYDSFAIATEDLETAKSLQFHFDTLKHATNNFSSDNKLGEGGFGIVYKGILKNGQEIAVKRLSGSSTQGVKEFKTEILLVAKLRHRNLVRLLGFCLAGKEKLLVYEFVPNKSLNYLLFGDDKQGKLDWKTRYKIIRGIVQGMIYLHHDSQIRIIHRDLKASNVLLDDDMNAKISDFGMARIFDIDGQQGNTSRIVGTYGYMAPEYALRGQFSIKSDVYSFGVLLLEIISGKRNSSFSVTDHEQDFLGYAWKIWDEERPLEFVDPTIQHSCSIAEVMKCLQIGLLCVQYAVDKRPTMAMVIRKLDGVYENLPAPEKPAFFMRSISSSKESNSDQSMTISMPYSTNYVSISEAEAR